MIKFLIVVRKTPPVNSPWSIFSKFFNLPLKCYWSVCQCISCKICIFLVFELQVNATTVISTRPGPPLCFKDKTLKKFYECKQHLWKKVIKIPLLIFRCKMESYCFENNWKFPWNLSSERYFVPRVKTFQELTLVCVHYSQSISQLKKE